MKIIKPSATIIEDELSKLSIYQRIDACASVCYQRPPKPTEEEAQEFCKKMLSVKHMSTLEMAVVHLVLPVCEASSQFLTSKYITHAYNAGWCLLTGSIRAFMEFLQYNDDSSLMSVRSFLAKEFPLFFQANNFRDYPKVRFAKPEEIPWQHKHVAARFIVNRAVSHELVRHRPCTFLQESQRYCRYEDEVTFVEPEWVGGSDKMFLWFENDCIVAEKAYKSYLKHGLKPQQARAVLPNSTKTELICYASLPQWKHMFDMRCSPAADPEMRRVMVPLREEFKEKYKEVEW